MIAARDVIELIAKESISARKSRQKMCRQVRKRNQQKVFLLFHQHYYERIKVTPSSSKGSAGFQPA
jgi:hypothetical protein